MDTWTPSGKPVGGRAHRRTNAITIAVALAVTLLASCSSSSTSSEATDGSALDARTQTSDGETADDRQGWVSTRLSPTGTSTLVVTSTDGLAWQPVSTVDAPVHDLVQGADGWIAVDDGASGATTVYTSADLRSWDEVATLDGNVRALAFGDGRFVAVGWASDRTGPQRPKAHWSDDGTTWTTVDLPDGLFLSNTPFGLTGGLVHTGTEFVAVQTGPVPGGEEALDLRSVVRRYRSPDGVTWTLEEGSELLAGGARVALAPGPEPGSLLQAVEVPGDETFDDTDGGAAPPPATDAVTIVGGDGATLERAAPDVALADHPADEIAYDGSTYLVLSTGPAGYNGDTPGPDVYRSTDGLTYEHLGQLTGHLGNVAHGTIGAEPAPTDPGGWVLLDRLTDSAEMVSEVLVSTDGGGWTEIAEIAENPLGAADRVQGVGQTTTAALIQGPTGWLAFGVGARSTDVGPVTLVRWSPDLRTWSTVAQVDGHLLAAAYGDGRFVAVGTTSPDGAGRGAADREPLAMVSTDGLAWERAELPTTDVTSLTSVTHVDGNGFLAAGTGALTGTGDLPGEPATVQSLVSGDGQTWEPSPQAPRAAGGASVTVAAGDDTVIQVAVPSDAGGTTVTGATATPIPTALEVLSPDGAVRDAISDSPFEGGPAGAADVHQLAHGDGTFLGTTANEQRTVVRTSRDGRTWDEAATLDGTVAVVVAYGYFDADADTQPSQPVPATSTPSTNAPDTSAPTTAPTVTSTTPPRASGSALGDEPTFHDDRASGSGCSPGAGDLPDGWWFGFARSQVSADSSFDFDLACYYTGSIGEQKASEAGLGFTGFVVTNDRTTTRPVAVSAGAVFRCVDPATQEQGPCSRPGASGFPVWVRVVSGRADKVVDQYVH